MRVHPTSYGDSSQPGLDHAAVVALVLGIASIPFFLFILPPVLAIRFGMIGRRNVMANPAKTGFGMATAGVVLGVVGLILLAAFLVLLGASDQS
ncbi:MAG: DUF4190 domain-containing protein [Actinomycetota bacterium]|nr:DUF4190 domain-containing protein [Actinomycetota bacterium]